MNLQNNYWTFNIDIIELTYKVSSALVVKSVDTLDLKSNEANTLVPVQVRPRANLNPPSFDEAGFLITFLRVYLRL